MEGHRTYKVTVALPDPLIRVNTSVETPLVDDAACEGASPPPSILPVSRTVMLSSDLDRAKCMRWLS